MTAMTYASLVSEVTSYLNNTNAATVARIPDFIYQAQQKLAMACKTVGIENYVVSKFITGTSVYQKPAGWRRSLSINFGTGVNNNVRNVLFERKYDYLRVYWPDSTVVNLPKFYSDYGYSNFLVAPTPDDDYPFEFSYLELPQPITENIQTNWWTNYAPQVLLNAVLLEAMYFLQDDERIQVFKAVYDEGVQLINDQDTQRLLDRSSNAGAD